MALAPLPCFVALNFGGSYVFQDHGGLEVLNLLALLALPATVVASAAFNSRGLTWRERAPFWALAVTSAMTSCLTIGLVERAARWVFERRIVAPRLEALVTFANDPTARARVERERGQWVLERDTPTIDGYTFERAAFTPAGAWFLLRPAHGIFSGEGLFVPFADVAPAEVDYNGSLRPDWLKRFRPCSVDGVYRFAGRDGMSGGGGWMLARSYEGAR